MPWYFIVCYEDIKQPVEKMSKEVEEMKCMCNDWAYRKKDETWLKGQLDSAFKGLD